MAATAASIPPLPDTWLQDAGRAASPGFPPPSPHPTLGRWDGRRGKEPAWWIPSACQRRHCVLQLRRGIPLKAGLTRKLVAAFLS